MSAALGAFAGSLFAAFAFLGLSTKLTSLDVRGIAVGCAFGLGAYGCFRAAARRLRSAERDV